MKRILFIFCFIVCVFIAIGCSEQKTPETVFNEIMKEFLSSKKFELHTISYNLEEYKIDSLYNVPYNEVCTPNIVYLCDSIDRFAWGYVFHKYWEKEWSEWPLNLTKKANEERKEKIRCLDSLKTYYSLFKKEYELYDNSFIGYIYKYRFSFTDNGKTDTDTAIVVTDKEYNLLFYDLGNAVDYYNEFFAKDGLYDKIMKIIMESETIETLLNNDVFLDFANIDKRYLY